MAKALVTGSAGFTGRHFMRHLHRQGWKVRGIDIVPGPLAASCTDARDFFRSTQVPDYYDLVLHCAASAGGRQVRDNDPLAQAVNLELDAGMFAWARRARPGRVVYFSSPAAYPVALQDEKRRCALAEHDFNLASDRIGVPDKLYGWAKVTGEMLARYARADGIAVTVVRPFSGYGEDQDDCYPFPAFVDRALRREDPFLVWGSGRQVRDWIHIDDIVDAVMRMYQEEKNGPANLGLGRPVSMRELAVKVCTAAGYSPAIECSRSSPSGPGYQVASPHTLSQFWKPKVSLEDGIERALEYRKRLLTD